ncbi:MAG: DNA-3-methyladenine glycosylase 2 family protein [Patescibacteria group bacterium]|nr:DNA-3-methyladenine glycosylase 2 family protein [Patescibacteria group bacterium]
MDYLGYFKRVDPVIYGLSLRAGIKNIEVPKDYFTSLTRKIVGQQLSVKAAQTIFSRFVLLFPKGNISPKSLLEIKDEDIRGAGLSWPKVRYLKAMAQDILDKKVVLEGLDKLTDEQIIEILTKLKGFGRWSAEMFLMFDLGREDIFSAGDLGLRRAIERHYKLKNPSEKRLLSISKKWTPYRTYACRVLWKSLELNQALNKF